MLPSPTEYFSPFSMMADQMDERSSASSPISLGSSNGTGSNISTGMMISANSSFCLELSIRLSVARTPNTMTVIRPISASSTNAPPSGTAADILRLRRRDAFGLLFPSFPGSKAAPLWRAACFGLVFCFADFFLSAAFSGLTGGSLAASFSLSGCSLAASSALTGCSLAASSALAGCSFTVSCSLTGSSRTSPFCGLVISTFCHPERFWPLGFFLDIMQPHFLYSSSG